MTPARLREICQGVFAGLILFMMGFVVFMGIMAVIRFGLYLLAW